MSTDLPQNNPLEKQNPPHALLTPLPLSPATTAATVLEDMRKFKPNAYLGLGLNAIQLEEEIHQIVNGAGGKLDQMYLYVSPASAAAWIKETALEDYKISSTIPVDEVMDSITRRVRKTTQDHLEVISLGSGEAYQEQRLIQTLMQKNLFRSVNLFLIDSSYPLLDIGVEGCQKSFSSYPTVETLALYQNFYKLPQNQKFLSALHRSQNMKLVTMLGYTFANLEQEVFFLRNTLNSFPSQTFLLIDIILPYAPANEPDKIKQKDPWLTGRTSWVELAENRWAIPFINHHPKVKNAKDMKFTPVLDNRTCQLTGSYAIEIRAQVENNQFTIQRLKRCDVQGLVNDFREEGWDLISSYPFYENKRAAVLFQKR